MAAKYYYANGRRKTATATVRLFEQPGASSVNGREVDTLAPKDFLKTQLYMPFTVSNLKPQDFSFTAKVNGGGIQAQLEAVRLAISKALTILNPEFRKPLKDAGLLTRDPRMVERKKPGLHKARKAEQYSKR